MKIWDLSVAEITLNHSVDDSVITSLASEQHSTKQSPRSHDEIYEIGTSFQCTICASSSTLQTQQDQRSHFRSDWHRYNLKRNSKGKETVSEEDFEKKYGSTVVLAHGDHLVKDIDGMSLEDSDLSSISGSDSGVEDGSSDSESQEEPAEQTMKKSSGPWVLYKASVENDETKAANGFDAYQIYRAILPDKENPSSIECLLRQAPSTKSKPSTYTKPARWILLMNSGGHFAGVVYEFPGNHSGANVQSNTASKPVSIASSSAKEPKIVAHKTFHHYTTRKSQGGSQTSSDKAQKAKSAGAHMRRQGAAMLRADIRTLLSSWSHYFVDSIIFVVAAGHESRSAIFGEGQAPESFAAAKADGRVRSVPIPTRRPTLDEARRVFDELSAVRNVWVPVEPIKALTPGEDQTKLRRKVETTNNVEESELDAVSCLEHRDEPLFRLFVCLCEVDPDDKLEFNFEGNDSSAASSSSLIHKTSNVFNINASFPLDEQFVYKDSAKPINGRGRTALQLASHLGKYAAVFQLLEHGADPALDKSFQLALDKTTRNVFRKFYAQYPERYDYKAAGISSMLTDDMEEEQERKEREKKARQRAKEKERKKVAKEKKLEKEKEQRELEEKEKEQQAQQRKLQAPASASASAPVGPMNPREAAAIAAEVRMGLRCATCKKSLAKLVPFEKLDSKYCSIACVQAARK